jgi:hypothetical protein
VPDHIADGTCAREEDEKTNGEEPAEKTKHSEFATCITIICPISQPGGLAIVNSLAQRALGRTAPENEKLRQPIESGASSAAQENPPAGAMI